MNLLNRLFGSNEGRNSEAERGFWKILTSEQMLEDAVQKSHEKKVVLFKHSTRCFISQTVLKNFEREVESSDKDAEYYFLDLLAFRSLSNRIAELFDIEHQSPQMIVLEKGKAIKNASHNSISVNLV
ncbi:bacillithiol system redox-active protein YtxJ [Kaistella sp. PBT33-4]|uniref:bacillithiol system redox-active protein YtxJ n=1 Tax=Kaistella sp. PBT33-4 TaxID=3032000 RepID=UPI0023D8719D|nr:bacillithiol system redox-active protein YtxJ [Kaistella sp. PBT33-4]MDF0720777.1 bacillithiol system redox-active protein YtxJ [Kaistella sp. PBT33-4]